MWYLIHPKIINIAKDSTPWEPMVLVEPKDLPEFSQLYPEPWTAIARGSGRFDILDAQQRLFAYLICWTPDDYQVLHKRITSIV